MQGWVSTRARARERAGPGAAGVGGRGTGAPIRQQDFLCWEAVISPAEGRNPWLAGSCWGWDVAGLALHQLHELPMSKWGLYLGSIYRLTPISLARVLLLLDCSSQLHAFSLFSSAIRGSSCNPVLLFLVFPLSSCDSPSLVITLLTRLLETPSCVLLLIFKGFFRFCLWSPSRFLYISSLDHLLQKQKCRSHYCTNNS